MGKKKNRRGTKSGRRETRVWAYKYLQKFIASDEDTYVFDAGLGPEKRAIIHGMCPMFGLKSKSQGSGDERRLSVTMLGPPETRDRYRRLCEKTELEDVDKEMGQRDGGKEMKQGDGGVKAPKALKAIKAHEEMWKEYGRGKRIKAPLEKLKRVSFTLEAKPVLSELFTRYPPGESDTTESALSVYTGHLSKPSKWRDDFFRKPRMKKADVVKKVASLNSRLAKDKGFREIFEARSKLPITSFKEAITSAVESNQVVLIAGETGCGKTTQVPQYLLDDMWNNKQEACKIICTQPRRISAISVSERISWERGEAIGNNIGYKVRLQSQGGRESSVVFCTNGVMLRVLVGKGSGRHLPDITHIIVDEIHERDCYSDFMLAILRDLLPSNPHLRLILMSATLDAERFSGYFGGCPVVRVPGFTYPVRTFYLEDVLSVVKSGENNNVNFLKSNIPDGKRDFSVEDKVALDEAINLAWTNDEFDDLLDLVSLDGINGICNYRHSSTWLTPLMVFAGKGRVTDVCKLLSLGADCKLKSKEGITALELAEKENHLEAAQIIREHLDKIQSNSQQAQELLDKYMVKCNSEDVDVGLIVQLIRKICCDSEDGAFLVFLPGWDEISKTKEKLLLDPSFADSAKFIIMCLHSRIPAEEQKKVFNRPPRGCRKIVLATNIAESAVTIDDVVYVIDSGRMKEKSYDPYSDVATLQSSWVSKANAKQREGRAGRCQPGICYHLYSKLRAATLPEYGVPEVRRMPVDELCLQVKILEPSCNVYDFLQKLMDPPVDQSIANALTILKDIRALTPQEELTELGHKFGQLPIHPRMSKMLYFAILVNCLEPALILACAAESKDPFIMPITPGEKKKAAASKHELASLYGGYSDHLATVAAFQCWKNAKRSGQSQRFCSQFFVSPKAMQMLDSTCRKLHGELKRHGLIPRNDSNCSLNAHDPGILRAVVAVGLYPMIGRMCPPSKNSGKSLVEIITGAKVKVRSLSNNSKMSSRKQDETLIVFDEITRGDWDVHIRSCTVLPTISLLLFSGEIAVAPKGRRYLNKTDDKKDHEVKNGGDVMDTDEAGGRPGEKIMLAPENLVKVVVDQWLPFEMTAVEVAQMYILRDRLMASILFKVKHPEENLPAHLGASMYAIACMLSYDGLAQPSSPTVAEKPIVAPAKSVINHALLNVEEITASDLSNGNEQIQHKSANNLDLGNMEEKMPSDPATGNEQTEPRSANILDLVNMKNNIPADLANGNEQAEPNMEEKMPSDPATGNEQTEPKSANNLDLGNMEEKMPSDPATANEQTEPKSANNLDLVNMKNNIPSDLANGKEQTEPKSGNNLDLGNLKENMPSDLANGNGQTDSETALMEAASVAKQPEKKRSRNGSLKSANKLKMRNMEESMPSDLANGNEQTEPETAPMEAASVAKQPEKKRSRNGSLKSANKLKMRNMEESMPSDLANGNDQTESETAPMEASSVAKQPEKKRSRNRSLKSAKKLKMRNMEESMPSDLANGNEQTEPETAPMEAASGGKQPEKKRSKNRSLKSAKNLEMRNMEESMPSDLAIGNVQTEFDTDPMEAASGAKQPEKKRSKNRSLKSANKLKIKNMEESTASDLAKGNEQT